MNYTLRASIIIFFINFFMDYFIFYKNHDFIYIINVNLTIISLWNKIILVLSFLLFGYILIVIGSEYSDERKKVDKYISRTVEATDALRYNLYSMKIAIKSTNDLHNSEKLIESIDEGLTVSIDLIDSYVETVN